MLQSLGLSSSENNVYLSLIQQTMQGAKEIAHNLQIPLSKAYQTLTNLENLGIIIKNKTRPASFSANEPKQVIDTLLKLRTEELEQVVKQASTIEQQLYQLIDIRRLDSNTLQINVGKKLREKNALVMLSTEKILKIAVQIKPSHFELNNLHLQTLFEKLSSLHQRGVRLQIIIGCDPVHQDDLNRFLNESVEDQIRNQIRFIEQVNTIFYIIDDVKILIKIVDPLTGDYNFTSVTIWEPIFVDLFKDKFAILWASYVKTTFDDRPH